MDKENGADESVVDNTQSNEPPEVITIQSDSEGNVTIAGDGADDILEELANEEAEEMTWQNQTSRQIASLQEQLSAIQSTMMTQSTTAAASVEAVASLQAMIASLPDQLKPVIQESETLPQGSILEPANVIAEAQAITEPAEKAARKQQGRWI